MNYKNLIQKLGFTPKENASRIYQKKYSTCNDYLIEVDFEKEKFLFGREIKAESQTTQNFSQAENWVVLECVDRLLEKGYKPQKITLEKTWKTGHGTSGRLDILVACSDNCDTYLMIECKTWGTEFDKEFKNLEKNGGQLFTYFQQDKNAEVLMLYASKLEKEEIIYRNEIVKIEEDYRQTANVKDFFERWNKLPKSNGIFDSWATAYEFQSKALTKKDLIVLKEKDSGFIFNRFLEILRHNVVSDKPNAFNKIFTLFLCKIIDEDRNDDEELDFQWKEGEDDHTSFQKRLTDLYNRGMLELLEKEVTDLSDSEFDKQFQQVDDKYKDEFKKILTKIRLEKNNEFAIKEVYDNASFKENAKVVKEVVELLQGYKIRYNYRQQFLSDFFELLLTTGLKQESGQFFTPVPIARFIIRSLPIQEITNKKIEKGNQKDLLPNIIDYAAGSGHFITESMEEVQKYIDGLDENKFNPTTKKAINKWKGDQFDWAEKYVYGIEKDYRLVKTSKVSCYLHGDGLAKIIHGDGLSDFATSTEFKDLLKETDKTHPQDNKQFDIVISNPPYSVSAFKGLMDEEKSKIAFDLYDRLTDQSSEIECLFVERTKQLLKDGGIAGVILPSSILSNAGIYTQTREIILKYFDVVGITEMGSNTFMATGTNTVILFLKRRNNADWGNIQSSVSKIYTNTKDDTINGIENPISKYVTHVWKESITYEDYKTLLEKKPNEAIIQHEIYQEYQKKIKAKDDKEENDLILALEREKLLYFIIALPQKIVLVKTGSKKEEKKILGYEFSNRRGSEGIHPIQRGKTIDDCTQLYDADIFDNPEKASTYIYKAFSENCFDLDIPENLQNNISYQNLVNMITFDRVNFEKKISLSVKKKVEIESKYAQIQLGEVAKIENGFAFKSTQYVDSGLRVIRIKNVQKGFIQDDLPEFIDESRKKEFKKYLLKKDDTLVSMTGNPGRVGKIKEIHLPALLNQRVGKINIISNKVVNDFIFIILNTEYFESSVVSIAKGLAQLNASASDIESIKIPLPPKDVQEKIVEEIEVLEKEEQETTEEVEKLNEKINNLVANIEIEKKPISYFLNLINPNKNNTIKDLPLKTNVSFLKMEDVSNEARVTNLQTRELKQVKTGYTFFQENDVLFAKITPCTENGKGALVPKLENNIGFGSTEFYVLRANNLILPKFLFYITKTQDFRVKAENNMTGTSGHRRVPKSFIENYEIPHLSISEQQKIVQKIEKIEVKINTLEKEIASIPDKKELILKKYLE